ncbi:MAG: hypothetical protein RLZZ338_1915 [Cyanobacteriota bacterium]|jgi:CBS domain containing-hemolysin-like protein
MMLSWTDILSRLFAVLLLIAINAFFVAAEFSMVSVRRSRINQLAARGDLGAKTVQRLQQNIELLLSTTQLGITLSSLALGWIGEATLTVLVRSSLISLPLPSPIKQALAHSLSLSIISFFLLVYFQIVLGELVPKSVAWVYPEHLAKFLGPFSLAIARFFHPFILIINRSTRGLLQFFGIPFTIPHSPITSEELQLIIQTSSESIGLEKEERQMLNNVFEFSGVSAQEVMVTRTNIITIPKNATFQILLDEISKTGHTRYPIRGESLDNILGIIDFKLLAKPLSQGLILPQTPLYPWIRSVRFVPEGMPLNELLTLMQRTGEHLLILVDEYGGTAGLVTLKDLIAELIGTLPNNSPYKPLDVQILDSQTFLVQAQLNLAEVNDFFKWDLPLGDEYQTLGGFLINQMQKIPNVGESFTYQNLEFTVISTSGARLDQIRINQRESSFYPQEVNSYPGAKV